MEFVANSFQYPGHGLDRTCGYQKQSLAKISLVHSLLLVPDSGYEGDVVYFLFTADYIWNAYLQNS